MSTSPASQAPSVPPPSSGGKTTRILACVLCQHRKIKCDRTFPCANCIKANVTCTPSTPAPARKRRRPNQDLQERLARCEELLKAYATAKPDDDAATPSTLHSQQPTADDGATLSWKPKGKLVVEDDGGVRFVDSFMVGTIYDELRAMREIIDGEDAEDVTPDYTDTAPDDNADLILSSTCGSSTIQASQSTKIEDLQPSPGHIFRLWQIYLERVNPLTKIIHVPTLQPYLVEATSGSQNIPKNISTLLFAIYTLATVSMTPDECLTLLGYSRNTALQRFSNGVRQSLVRTGFLMAHDLETLQALVIYLISLQGRYNRHAAWILNGVVLRIAQKMGLHRDGELLGLSPFETEMRRRIWWQIIMVDAKYALMSGLSHSMLPRIWDTKEPRNVNDADLFPAATEPVVSREGPTEMIMVMLQNRVARFLLETPGIEPMLLMADNESLKYHGGPSPEQVTAYRQVIADLGQSLLDIIDKYCDPSAGPLHEMALDMKSEIMDKLEGILLPPKEQKFGNEVKTPADNVFRIAIHSMCHNAEHYSKSKDKGFAWYSRVDFQVNIFLFIVGQLCSRTSGELVETAWNNVQSTFENHPDLYDISQRSYFQVATYVLKAWKKREMVLQARLGGMAPEIPEFVQKLRTIMPAQDDVKTEASPLAGTMARPSSTGTSAGVSMFSPSGDFNTMEEHKDISTLDPMMEQFLGQPFFDADQLGMDVWDMMSTGAQVIPNFDSLGPGTESQGNW